MKPLLPTSHSSLIFDQLDSDDGGELDVAELKAALKKLQEAAGKASDNEARLLEERGRLRRRALQQQELVRRNLEEDDFTFGREEARAREREETAARVAEEERLAKATAKAERKAMAAQAKQQFEANVAAKRLASKVHQQWNEHTTRRQAQGELQPKGAGRDPSTKFLDADQAVDHSASSETEKHIINELEYGPDGSVEA